MMVHCKRARPCKVLLSRLHFGKFSLFHSVHVYVYWGIDKIIFNWCLSSWNAIINSIVSKRPPGACHHCVAPNPTEREREGESEREWERCRAFGPILGRPNKSLLLLLLSFALQLCQNIVLSPLSPLSFWPFLCGAFSEKFPFLICQLIESIACTSCPPGPVGSGPFQSWHPPSTFFCLLMSLIYVVNCFRF